MMAQGVSRAAEAAAQVPAPPVRGREEVAPRTSIQRNILATLALNGWTALLGLVAVPVYLHYLGIEAYGLIGFFATLQAWMFVLDLGITQTVNREMARFGAGRHAAQEIADLFRSMELLYGCLSLLIALGIAAASGWLATSWLDVRRLDTGAVAHALAWTAASIAAQWMAAFYRNAMMGLQHHVRLSAVLAVAATLRAGAAIMVLALFSASLLAFVLSQLAVTVLEASVLGVAVRRRLPVPPSPATFRVDALRGVWRFAAGLGAINVLAILLMQGDKLLLSRLLPLGEFGYVTLALTLAGSLTAVIVPVHNVAYPRLNELVAGGGPRQLADEYHRFAQLLAMAVVPPTLLLCVFSRELVTIWTGDAHTAREVAPILSVWVVGAALNGLMNVPYAAQLAHGWARLTVAINAAAVAVLIPAMLYFVPRHGAIAAAWIWVLLNTGYIVFSVGLMHRRILVAEKWKWYLQDVLTPLACACGAIVLVAWMHARLQPLQRLPESLFLLCALALLAAATAAGAPVGRAMLRSALRQLPGIRP